MQTIKNTAKGARGFTVGASFGNASAQNAGRKFIAAPGRTFQIEDDDLKTAQKDKAISAMFDSGELIVLDTKAKAKEAAPDAGGDGKNAGGKGGGDGKNAG